MQINPDFILTILGVILLVGENWIVRQVRKINDSHVPTAKLLILFSFVGSTIAGIPSTLIQNHIDVYVFFPFYGVLLAFFIKRSYGIFKKLKTKMVKTWFIIHFAEGSYFLLAIGIYMYFMAPFANMISFG